MAIVLDVFELVPSARFGAGAMTGQGYGVTREISATTEWYALGGGLEARVRWALSPGADLAVVLGGDVMAALVRPEFVILGGESVFTPPEVSASFSLGLRAFVR